MRDCWLEIERGVVVTRIERRAVTPQGSRGLVEGACPGCGITPFLVVGCDVPNDDPETRKSGGRCVACKDPVGYIYARGYGSTIFGREEDDAVITHGRARVYGLEAPR